MWRLYLSTASVAAYVVDRCWDSEFTRERCCRQKDPACWQDEFTFETCCTGDPLCWEAGTSMTYENCCNGSDCWNGLFTYGRCCSRDLVRTSTDCSATGEVQQFLSFAEQYITTNKTSSALSVLFKHISDYWPCPEAVVLGLLYSMESNPACDRDCSAPFLDVIQRLLSKTPNSEEKQLVTGYFQRVSNQLDAVGAIYSTSSLDLVLPFCGEDVEWLVEGIISRLWYLDASLKHSTRFILVNKCPLRSGAPNYFAQFDSLRPLVREFVVLDVYESVIGQECTGNLEYIVSHYTNLSDYSLFFHPDMEEHVPVLEVLFDTICFVTNGFFTDLFDSQKISFLPLGLNFLDPFWVRHDKFRKSFKRFHAKLFSLSAPSLSPEPANSSLYCCAQFLVKKAAIHTRSLGFYQHALGLMNDPATLADIFGFPGHRVALHDTKNKEFCEFMMLEWQLMFGEDVRFTSRQETAHLPLYYKSRNIKLSS